MFIFLYIHNSIHKYCNHIQFDEDMYYIHETVGSYHAERPEFIAAAFPFRTYKIKFYFTTSLNKKCLVFKRAITFI